MTFDSMAKDLIKTKLPVPDKQYTNSNNSIARANALVELAESGFSRKEIFDKLSELYDECGEEDKAIKKALLEMVIKVHGLYKDEDKKEAPIFNFNINADPARVAMMLCPPMVNEEAA